MANVDVDPYGFITENSTIPPGQKDLLPPSPPSSPEEEEEQSNSPPGLSSPADEVIVISSDEEELPDFPPPSPEWSPINELYSFSSDGVSSIGTLTPEEHITGCSDGIGIEEKEESSGEVPRYVMNVDGNDDGSRRWNIPPNVDVLLNVLKVCAKRPNDSPPGNRKIPPHVALLLDLCKAFAEDYASLLGSPPEDSRR